MFPAVDNQSNRRQSASVGLLFFRFKLDKLGIYIHSAAFEAPSYPSTPEKEFLARKVRYTVGIGLRRITRETTCDRLFLEVSAFISDHKATLLGIDGINGFRCGPTDQELGMFAHPLQEEPQFERGLGEGGIEFTHRHALPGPGFSSQ
jgi:hypothetical protein